MTKMDDDFVVLTAVTVEALVEKVVKHAELGFVVVEGSTKLCFLKDAWEVRMIKA